MSLALVGIAAALLLASEGEPNAPSASGPPEPGTATWRATWAFRPDTVDQLVDSAPFAVSAVVTAVEAGDPLVGEDEDEEPEPDEPPLPTQRVALDIDEVIYGNAPARLALLKTGSADAWFEDDPPYQVGERYLLFLTEYTGQAGLYVNTAPDGRLPVVGGSVEPLIPGAIADALGGRSEEQAERLIREAAPPQ